MKFYVYRIYDGMETVYVGKGCGARLKRQIKRFGLQGEIIEICKTDDDAFKREVHWIATLMPTSNKNTGGGGGRAVQKPITPEMARANREYAKFEREYGRLGPRRYAAKILVRKLNSLNCEQFGVSKVDLSRLHEVANGPWC